MDAYIGEIRMFAGNYAPEGWALCNGQLLHTEQHQALFAILGATYGGNGRTTFGLPDLRGRVPLHAGLGPGLTERYLGWKGGLEAVSLLDDQMPPHTHSGTIKASSGGRGGNSNDPEGNYFNEGGSYRTSHDVKMASDIATIGFAGGGRAHYNMQPCLVINFIIALQGIFPPRH